MEGLMNRQAAANVTPVRQRTQYTCNKGVNWDKAPLGELSDGEVAVMYGVTRPVVCNARNRRGISPHTPRCAAVTWDEAPLGELPDAVVAEKLGVSQPTVTRHRNQRGVPPFRAMYLTTEGEGAHSYPEALLDLHWHEQGIPHRFQVPIGPFTADWVLGDGTVVEYAGFLESRAFGTRYREHLIIKVAFYESLGLSVQVIGPDELGSFQPDGAPRTTKDIISGGINWSKQPLGGVTDTELAARLGVRQTTVSRWRAVLGIAPYDPPARDWSSVPLGVRPDAALAADLGVSKETVRRARSTLNIPSHRSNCHAA